MIKPFEMWAYLVGTEYHHTRLCTSIEEGERFVAQMATEGRAAGHHYEVDPRALANLDAARSEARREAHRAGLSA